jgi:hypothetical protein
MSNYIGMFCSGMTGLLCSGMVAYFSPEYSEKDASGKYKFSEQYGFIGLQDIRMQKNGEILCSSISEKAFCVRQSVIFMSAFLLRYLTYLTVV